MVRSFWLCSLGLLMTHHESHFSPHGSTVGGRLSLMALRVFVKETALTPEYGYILLPDTASRGAEEASQLLAAMPKPLECTGNRSGNTLVVTCLQMSDTRRREFDGPSSEAAQGFGEDIRTRAPGESDPFVEVRGAGEAILVRLSDFQRWLTEYDLPGGFVVGRPDDKCLTPEVRTVIRLYGRT
jgi:hypothetical protein